MAQLNTIYDKDLKEKIFILKGEERYARTTDCILEEITHESGADVDPETGRRSDWNTHMDYFLLEFRIDVLRDIGASYVTLYDNDEVIGVFDFDTNSHYIDLKYEDVEHDNRLRFTYDVEHNLYAKYMGNKNCLKSKSKMYTFKEDTPSAFTSSITYTGLNDRYISDPSISFTVSLVSEGDVASKTLKVYDGTTLITTDTTDDNGSISVSLPTMDNGLHSIRTVFDGNEYITASEYVKNVSIGVNVQVIKYPSCVLNSDNLYYIVSATDYHGNPFTNIPMITKTSQGTIGVVSRTSSIGRATLTIPNSSFNTFVEDGVLKYECIYFNHPDMGVELSTNWYDNASVAISVRDTIISNSVSTQVVISTNVPEPVTGTYIIYSNHPFTTGFTTDEHGAFIMNYMGRGYGDTRFTAEITDSSHSVTIEDVLQYWNSDGKQYNINYNATLGSVTKLSNGWRFNSSREEDRYACSVNLLEDYEHIDSSLEFTVISASGVNKVFLTPTTVSANDKFRIEKSATNNECKVYKNNQLINTVSLLIQQSIIFEGNSGCYMVLDKIKQKRI